MQRQCRNMISLLSHASCELCGGTRQHLEHLNRKEPRPSVIGEAIANAALQKIRGHRRWGQEARSG